MAFFSFIAMRIIENLSKVHEHIDFPIKKLYNENNEYEVKAVCVKNLGNKEENKITKI